MADTVQTGGMTRAAPVHNNRISARSTRKKKTTILSPKKFCDQVIGKMAGVKSFEAGCAEFYREMYQDSPTFRYYFEQQNIEKNISDDIWLYDATRVILPDGDYIHASWVDGVRPRHYILAQMPHDDVTKKTFFKMLAHVKAEGLILAEGSDEMSQFVATNFEKPVKKSAEKAGEDLYATAVISENGLNKLKAVKLCKWINEKDMNAVELAEAMTQTRKFLGCPLKGPIVIACKDGCFKSGIIAYLDTEADRVGKTGRLRFSETVKNIRYQRYMTFDKLEWFELAVNALAEFVKPLAKKK